MKCANCQNEIQDNITRCTYCGQEIKSQIPMDTNKPKGKKWASLVYIVFLIGMAVYGSVQNKGAQKNEEGIDILDTGSNYNQAIDNFSQAFNNVKNDEDKITILKNWAYALWMNEQYPEAKQKFNEALFLAQPDSADYYLISAEIALLDQNGKAAEEDYLKAIAQEPDNYQINTSLGVFYLGIDEASKDFVDYEKSLLYTKKAYDAKPGIEMTKENLANSYFYLGQYQQAIDLFKQTTLDNKPFNNYMLGLCYYALKDEDNARTYLQKAVDMGYEPEPEVREFLEDKK
ncbi:MAG: tetratricopeptide repeat protein [Candidatus Parcubacteria bacterium]|nr:tetratricopeptide repeat protein [Candidatus Parcubacteria bacterium]